MKNSENKTPKSIILPILMLFFSNLNIPYRQKYLHIFWGGSWFWGIFFVWRMFQDRIILGLGILAQNGKKVKAE
jgi:hypothetical protein